MNKTPFLQLIAVVLAIVSSNQTFSQKKALPGYYITLNGDNVKGTFPNYTQWNKNPAQVDFIAAGETKHTSLTPQNTRKFVVEGYDEYVSYTGKRLVNPIDKNVLFNETSFVGSDDMVEDVTVFLRLETATAGGDLYVLNDAKRINFFYQAPGEPMIELRYKKAFDQKEINEMAEYKQQLSKAFAAVIEQKKLDDRLEKLTYTEKNLSSFFQAMFPTARTEYRHTDAARWIISGGVAENMVRVQVVDLSYNTVQNTTYPSSFSPLLSVGFFIPVNRNFGRFFLYPQLKLYSYKNTKEEKIDTLIYSATYQATFTGMIEFSGGCNIVNNENFKFFLAAGLGIQLQYGARQVLQIYKAADHSPHGPTAITGLPTLFYTADVSAGVSLNKKMMLSVTYMLPTHLESFGSYAPILSGVQLRVGYMF